MKISCTKKEKERLIKTCCFEKYINTVPNFAPWCTMFQDCGECWEKSVDWEITDED